MSGNVVEATYKFECEEGFDVERIANEIAFRQTIGEWDVLSLPEEVKCHGAECARMFKDSDTTGRALIKFPIENFDLTSANVPAILNILAGDIFGWKDIKNIMLEDFKLPEDMVKLYPGPKFGLRSIRKMLGVEGNQPIFGVTIKPSLGLSSKYIAEQCKIIAQNGADFITDDEKLVSPSYCRIEHRIKAVSDALDEVAEKRKGNKPLYIINITNPAHKICEIAKKVTSYSNIGLMISFITGGFDCLQAVAEDKSINVPIWAHRTMHGALTRKPHGLGMNVLVRLCRLTGADFQHIGPIGGTDAVIKEHVKNQRNLMTEAKEWFGLKPSFPVVTGGVNPINVFDTINVLGHDIAFAVGAAVFDHPGGLKDGVKAMRQAIDAATKKVKLPAALRDHRLIYEWKKSRKK